MQISQDIKDRITAAAAALYEEAGRSEFPTVAAVRARAGADMNAASLVMREWRRAQTVQAAPVVVEVPEKVRAAHVSALAALWSEAQGLANERLLAAQTAWEAERGEAEALRAQLSEAFEGQRQELEVAQVQIEAQARQIAQQQAEGDVLRAELVAATARAGTAETRAGEIEHRANDLAVELERVHAVGAAERERHAVEMARRQADLDQVRVDGDVLRAELVTLTARAGAAETRVADLDRRASDLAAELGRVHAVGMAERERLEKAEADREQERRDAGKAREEAARLQGMVDAMTQQAGKKEGSA